MSERAVPQELELDKNTFLVSRANEKGKILYANQEFFAVSGFDEKDLIGSDHNIIRHPEMPKAVFRLLWDTIKAGTEFNGYVKNLCKDGRYYWVFATITQSISSSGIIYYSIRKKPTKKAIDIIRPIYESMLVAEKENPNDKSLQSSLAVFTEEYEPFDMSYDEYILTL